MKKPVLLLCLIAFAAMHTTIRAAAQAQNDEIPREVAAWIESEVAKSDTPPVADLHSPLEFFGNEKNARLVGYIKGYDPQAGFSVGRIEHFNSITGEILVSVIEIEPDGRFTSDVRIVTPACPVIRINNRYIDLYLEPGQTLGIILDYGDLVKSGRETISPVTFYGFLATINEEFNKYKIPFDWKPSDIADPWEFKKHQLKCWKSQSDELDKLIENNTISPKSADILRSNIINNNVLALLDYIFMLQIRNQGDEEVGRRIDSITRNGYYDFMRADFMNDPALLIPSESYVVINRYEFEQTPHEIVSKLRKEAKIPPALSDLDIQKLELRLRDSTNKNRFRLQPNLICDIVKIHDLKRDMGNFSKEEARELATYAAFGFANPFMVMWSERIYNEKFPSGGIADEPYELPQGKATDIFKRIIDPLRGKVIMVDFWGTTCGPCVMAISDSKRVREEYKDDRMAFVYITDESWSPDATAYDKFVAENFMPNTFRLSNDESNYLSQLFGISGRPHYMIISPDGRVAVKNFHTHFAKFEFDELIAKYFPAE